MSEPWEGSTWIALVDGLNAEADRGGWDQPARLLGLMDANSESGYELRELPLAGHPVDALWGVIAPDDVDALVLCTEAWSTDADDAEGSGRSEVRTWLLVTRGGEALQRSYERVGASSSRPVDAPIPPSEVMLGGRLVTLLSRAIGAEMPLDPHAQPLTVPQALGCQAIAMTLRGLEASSGVIDMMGPSGTETVLRMSAFVSAVNLTLHVTLKGSVGISSDDARLLEEAADGGGIGTGIGGDARADFEHALAACRRATGDLTWAELVRRDGIDGSLTASGMLPADFAPDVDAARWLGEPLLGAWVGALRADSPGALLADLRAVDEPVGATAAVFEVLTKAGWRIPRPAGKH